MFIALPILVALSIAAFALWVWNLNIFSAELAREQIGYIKADSKESKRMVTRRWARRSNTLGLGLAICRRSVEANNGVLSVRDAPGSGCVFTIELPRHVLA